MLTRKAKTDKNLNEAAERFLQSQSARFLPSQSKPMIWFEPGSQDRDRLDWEQLTQKSPRWDFHSSNEELNMMCKALSDISLAKYPVLKEERNWWRTAAWYQPMHCRDNGDWGIYFCDSAIRRAPEFFGRFADQREKAIIEKDAESYFNKICLAAAVSLFLRELFRHRLECYAIRLHSLTSTPCYSGYYSQRDASTEDHLATAYAYWKLSEDEFIDLLGKDVSELVRRGLRTLTSKEKEIEQIKDLRSIDLF